MAETANKVADFTEGEFKQFATRQGDRWSFSIPPHEMQILDSLLPDHVLVVENIPLAVGGEIMLGKLVKKK